ncbi:MAG: hypothetical protein QOD49_281 [Actinomycetota bacterium]|jgi:N-acetylneuraminic acid mutarotase|nr:hypothetical protein [Actinomycetota bacterium]
MLASAELYHPATRAWSATGSMSLSLAYHSATLLRTGEVLVAGGEDSRGVAFASTELYDPASGSWSPIGSMIQARAVHTATALPDGRVLIAGGFDPAGYPLASAELLVPGSAAVALSTSQNRPTRG